MQTLSERLAHELVAAYYEGVGYGRLVTRIGDFARSLDALDDRNPGKARFRSAAKTLWGGAPGDPIDPEHIEQALAGPEGPAYVRAWVYLANEGIRGREAA